MYSGTLLFFLLSPYICWHRSIFVVVVVVVMCRFDDVQTKTKESGETSDYLFRDTFKVTAFCLLTRSQGNCKKHTHTHK